MKKNKGFTLIEIIVSLMIASIAMVIATTLILNSMGYFNKTAISDNDKQVLDSIKDYVQTELMYASDVRIQSEYPAKEDDTIDSGWHYLYVKDNQLYRDNDCETDFTKSVAVYGTDFYINGRKLFMQARGFNDYRVDLGFYLTDRNGTEAAFTNQHVYKTSTTIELLNLKEYITNQGGKSYLAQTDYVSLNNNDGFAGMKVFYKKDSLKINKPVEEPDVEYDGTVADELKCNPKGRDADDWNEKVNENNGKFSEGEFVKYNGVIYRAVKSSTSRVPPNQNGNNMWKRIYTPEWDKYSLYDDGDIVIYNNKYYICIKDINNSNKNESPDKDKKSWKLASDEDIENAKKEHAKDDYCGKEEASGGKWTVGEEHLRCEQGKNILDFDEIKEDNSNFTWYLSGTFVRYNGTLYRALKTISNTSVPPTGSDWKVITVAWSSESGYMLNDVVKYNGAYYRMIWYAGYIDPSSNNPEDTKDFWQGPYTQEELETYLTNNKDKQPKCTVRDGTGK